MHNKHIKLCQLQNYPVFLRVLQYRYRMSRACVPAPPGVFLPVPYHRFRISDCLRARNLPSFPTVSSRVPVPGTCIDLTRAVKVSDPASISLRRRRPFGAPRPAQRVSALFFHPQRRGFDRDIEAQRDGALIAFPEAQSYERSLFWPAWLYRFLPRGTCGAPWVIAPRRGELKRAPVSNLALCQVVGMREDGLSSRFFRGW